MRAGKERQGCRILRKYQLQLNRLNLIMQQLSHKCPAQGRGCRQVWRGVVSAGEGGGEEGNKRQNRQANSLLGGAAKVCGGGGRKDMPG